MLRHPHCILVSINVPVIRIHVALIVHLIAIAVCVVVPGARVLLLLLLLSWIRPWRHTAVVAIIHHVGVLPVLLYRRF